MPNLASLLQCVDSLVWAPIPPVWVEMRQCNLIGSSTLGHPKFVRMSPGLENFVFQVFYLYPCIELGASVIDTESIR